MANYLSRPYQQNQPVSMMPDMNLALNTIDTLQSRYDANKAAVDQMISQYESLRGLSDQDNQYIASKISQLKSQMESFGNIRFEHRSSVSGINKHFKTILEDPIVKSAIKAKAIYENYNAEVSKIKEKDLKNYSDQNYQYGLLKMGYYDYMNGATKELKSASYIPYTDVDGEMLKKLKEIKDIKGKRTIEMPVLDANGQRTGVTQSKSIDGLTDSEIKNYFEASLSPQAIQQLRINGYFKHGKPEQEKETKQTYQAYINKKIENEEKNLLELDSNSKNPLSGDKAKEYAKEYERVKYEVDSLKNLDVSKVNVEELAYQMEKLTFVNNLSQAAGAEWSVSENKDEIYFAMEDLAIKREDLLIKKAKAAREAKEAGEATAGATGNAFSDGIVASSARDTLLENMEEDAGQKSFRTEHDTANKGILELGKRFIDNAPKTDKENFLKLLKAEGVDENFNKVVGANSNVSIAKAIYSAFLKGNFDTAYSDYATEIGYLFNVKNQKAKDIIKVEKEAYLEEFNKNPDDYVNSFVNQMQNLSKAKSRETDLWGESYDAKIESDMELYNKAKNFLDNNGGIKNFKIAVSKDPNKVREFAEILDKMDNTFKGITPMLKGSLGMPGFYDQNLKEKATARVEELIKTKTNSGEMTSLYKDFTILNDKVKESILKMIPNERTFVKGTKATTLLDRSENANMSFFKQGDEIVIIQEQKGKETGSSIVSETRLGKNDAGYQEIMRYVDDAEGRGNTIKATSGMEFTPQSIRMTSHLTDETTLKKKQNAVVSTLAQNEELIKPFTWKTGADNKQAAISFAAVLGNVDTAVPAVKTVLSQKNIDPEKVQAFSDKLFKNINSYKAHIETTSNIQATGLMYQLNFKKGEDTVLSTGLGTDTLTRQSLYLLNSHPQIFLLSEMLRKVDSNNIDNYINIL